MTNIEPYIRDHPQGIIFKIYVQPRSSKNRITGLHGDAVKIKLTAPPIDGAANKMCIQYLAKCLDVKKSSLDILTGHTGRTKHVLLRTTEESAGPSNRKQLKNFIESLPGKKTA